MNFLKAAPVVMLLAGAFPTASNAAQLISNGGFENTGFGSTTNYYNVGNTADIGNPADHAPPTDFGWTISNGNVDIISYQSYGPAPTNGGSYGLDLVGYGSTGEISQTLSTVAGQSYAVSFDYRSNPGFVPASAEVLVDGSRIALVTGNAPNNGWTTFNGVFVATGASTTFGLNETSGGGNGGMFLDNVSVTAAPEASTWAMMMLGFAGLGFAGYRSSRKKAAYAA